MLSSAGLHALAYVITSISAYFPLETAFFKDENVGCYSLILSTAITHTFLTKTNWWGAGSGPWWVGEQLLQISGALSEL